jgi:hypothetical protein
MEAGETVPVIAKAGEGETLNDRLGKDWYGELIPYLKEWARHGDQDVENVAPQEPEHQGPAESLKKLIIFFNKVDITKQKNRAQVINPNIEKPHDLTKYTREKRRIKIQGQAFTKEEFICPKHGKVFGCYSKPLRKAVRMHVLKVFVDQKYA